MKCRMLVPVQTIVEQNGPGILSTRDEKGHTPAHWACLGGHTTILRFFIENKAPIDEPSNNDLGARPIHWAAVNGHIAVVDILIQTGISIDTVDNKGCTPLIVACQYGQTMLAGYLMGKGARLQLTDKDGDNALHWASFKGHPELIRLLIYSGFNARQRDNYWQTPLHLACINGNITAVKDLCEQDGVEIDLADKNGKTPLMLAVGRKHEDVVGYLKKEAKFRNSILPRIDFWALIFGPPGNTKGPLLFFCVSVLLWGYPMYIFKCLPQTYFDLQILHVLFFLTNICMWISLYHANTIDPGFLPRNVPEYDQAIRKVAHFDEWKHGNNPLKQLCHTCRTVKPLRAKHCRYCNRCVKEFDHHCPYIHNCVGYHNRAWFLGFLTSMMGLSVISGYFTYHMLFVLQWDWLVFVGALEAGLFFIMLVVVWYMTLIHASYNITTNERINRKRYDYLKDGKGRFYNPFNKGLKLNLLEFFHLKKPPKQDEVELLGVDVV
ncbi:hypothetical protein ACOMHN_024899 [Nucella lapillus]